jgi:hypothetical protein
MNPTMKLSALLFTMSISNPKPSKRAISRRSFLGMSLAVGGVVFVMVAIAQSALAQNSVMTQNLVRFSGGIGVIPTGSADTTCEASQPLAGSG